MLGLRLVCWRRRRRRSGHTHAHHASLNRFGSQPSDSYLSLFRKRCILTGIGNCDPHNIIGSQRLRQAVDPAFANGQNDTLSTMKFIMANGKSGMNSAYFAIAHSAYFILRFDLFSFRRLPFLPVGLAGNNIAY